MAPATILTLFVIRVIIGLPPAHCRYAVPGDPGFMPDLPPMNPYPDIDLIPPIPFGPMQGLPNIDYALLSYDILHGYPLSSDGRDPGFRQQIVRTSRSSVTEDGRFVAPFGIDVRVAPSCHTFFRSEVLRSVTELKDFLGNIISQDDGATLKHQFSSNPEYTELIENNDLFIVSTVECRFYSTTLDPSQVELEQNFKDLLTSTDGDYGQLPFREIFQNYGTHALAKVDFGSRFAFVYTMLNANGGSLDDMDFELLERVASINSHNLLFRQNFTSEEDVLVADQVELFESFVDRRVSSNGPVPPGDQDASRWESMVWQHPVPIRYSLLPLEDLITPENMSPLTPEDVMSLRSWLHRARMMYQQEEDTTCNYKFFVGRNRDEKDNYIITVTPERNISSLYLTPRVHFAASDLVRNILYFSDKFGYSVWSYNMHTAEEQLVFDGNEHRNVGTGNLDLASETRGLAIGWLENRLFISSRNVAIVSVKDGQVDVIVDDDVKFSLGMVVDEHRRELLWTDVKLQRLESISYKDIGNPGNRQVLATFTDEPYGLWMDDTSGPGRTLYTIMNSGEIWQIHVTSSSVTSEVVVAVPASPTKGRGLVMCAGNWYYTDDEAGALWMVEPRNPWIRYHINSEELKHDPIALALVW